MTVKLRGHHLLCMITYEGIGYTEKFARNFDALVERICRGETIEITEGPDDVCQALIDDVDCVDHHCHLRRISIRDQLALGSLGKHLAEDLRPGARLTLSIDSLQKIRTGFKDRTIRQACAKCEWEGKCTEAAAMDFQNSRLHLQA